MSRTQFHFCSLGFCGSLGFTSPQASGVSLLLLAVAVNSPVSQNSHVFFKIIFLSLTKQLLNCQCMMCVWNMQFSRFVRRHRFSRFVKVQNTYLTHVLLSRLSLLYDTVTARLNGPFQSLVIYSHRWAGVRSRFSVPVCQRLSRRL